MRRKLSSITKQWFVILAILFCIQGKVFCAEIHFKNGDRLSGTILSETEKNLLVTTETLGKISIKKQYVKRVDSDKISEEKVIMETKVEKEPKLWKNQLTLGYNQKGGNTKNQTGSAKLSMNRKTESDEWTLAAGGDYGSSDKKLDMQKFAGLIRYAFSFGERLKWYNFYKVEGSRDRFANINYRLVPSIGIGYWFSDEEKFKAMTEIGVGLQHTNFRDDSKTTNEAILVPHAFMEKALWKKLIFSQEVILYPSLSEMGEYRFFSKTKFSNPINETLSLQFSFIDEFNSNPSGDTKRNDFRIQSGIQYNF